MQLKLTKDQYNSLVNILDYYYNDEKKDYSLQKKEQKANHIFKDLNNLKKLIK